MQIFAHSVDARQPRGWLVDLLNRFGHLGGFERLLERFTKAEIGSETKDGSGGDLSVPLVHVLVKPFGQCAELLTQETITTYLMPIVEIVPK